MPVNDTTRTRSQAISNFKRILHPTDFSPAAAAAFDYARALAGGPDAVFTLLHVAQRPIASLAGMPVVPPPPPVIDRAGLEAQLQAMATANPQLRMECRLVEGDPVSAILDAARDTNCDAIVLGTHGWTGLSRLLMGNVAEQIVRRATCPVVTVKTPATTASL